MATNKHLAKRMQHFINNAPKSVKQSLKEIADGVFFKGFQDDKAIIIVDGKEKALKVNETKKGKFVRLNNITTYL